MQISKHPVVETIQPEIAATVADFGYELVQITYGGPRGSRRLTIYIDKSGGVTSGDCARMTERLSLLLESIDATQKYGTLIVSSPGVERPLTRNDDFVRFVGKTVSVTVQPPSGKKATRTGVIQQVADDQVRIVCADRSYEIPLADMVAAHLVYNWAQEEHEQC